DHPGGLIYVESARRDISAIARLNHLNRVTAQRVHDSCGDALLPDHLAIQVQFHKKRTTPRCIAVEQQPTIRSSVALVNRWFILTSFNVTKHSHKVSATIP